MVAARCNRCRAASLAGHRGGQGLLAHLHDGTLKAANNTLSQTDPRYALIIAGIIEMALLSCTHVIATHTQNSLGSKWIPYELARAKGRRVISSQAAGWFDGSILKPETQGEYVVLAEIWRGRAEVDRWLGAPRP
jgi:hypothetical protein